MIPGWNSLLISGIHGPPGFNDRSELVRDFQNFLSSVQVRDFRKLSELVLDFSKFPGPGRILDLWQGTAHGQMIYTQCTLKLRPVKLLFVIFGRLSYSLFVNLMVWGNGRLSYLILKNHPFFIEK